MGNCVACVRPDELLAVEVLGDFKSVKGPGCHCLGCDCFNVIIQTRTLSTRVEENKITSNTKTKDNVFVDIGVAVQLEVIPDKAYAALYKLSNVNKQIESYVSDVVRGTVPKMKIDELFESKDEIAQAVKERLSVSMEDYGYLIKNVLVIELKPDNRVKDSMNDIDANRRLRIATQEKAEADKILEVKAAEAEAESKFLQGQGIARQRTAIAEGLRNAVGGSKGLDSKDVQELLLITQYFDTLDKLAQGKSTTVFMPASMEGLAEQVRDGTMQALPAQQSMRR